jgi:ribulose-bisphosphate carboxylase large chain
VSEVSQAATVRLVGLELSPRFLAASPRPRVGVTGTRASLGVPRGHLTAAQPPLPGSAVDLAESVADLLAAGTDIVRDPMLFADPPGLPLAARVDAVRPVIARHRERTGRGCMFAYSVDDLPDAMVEHAEALAGTEGAALQLSAGAIGLSALAHLRRRTDLPLHARTAPQPMLVRDRRFGIADSVMQALWRLAGLDHLPVPPDAGPEASADRLRPLLGADDRALPVLPPGSSTDVDDAIELLSRSEVPA